MDSLARVFLHYGPFFNLYSEYLRNYQVANSRLQELTEASEDRTSLASSSSSPSDLDLNGFIETLQQVHPDWRGKNLQHFLIMPVQRIPRYVLLLRDLLRHTPARLICGRTSAGVDLATTMTAAAAAASAAATTSVNPQYTDADKALVMMKRIASQVNLAIDANTAAPRSLRHHALVAQKPVGTTNITAQRSMQQCQVQIHFALHACLRR
jgi:hypothetical protein